MIAFSGVRSSCDMFARNSLLCRLAVSSSLYSRRSSSFIALTLVASAPSSSRFARRACPEKSPAAIAASRASMRWIGPISDQESTSPSSKARTIAPAATPMNRFRELAYELAFCAISELRLGRRQLQRAQSSRSRCSIARFSARA